MRGETGALFIGDAETVARKIHSVSEALGGLARITLQMSVVALPHAKALRAIEILGNQVIPMMRNGRD